MAMVKRSSWQIQKAVWFALFIRELKIKVGEHSLGPLWILVEPLIHISLLAFIFSYLRDRADFQGVPFIAFFAMGLLPYFIFQHTVTRSVRIIFQGKSLFAYRQVKPIDLIIVVVMVELFVSSMLLTLLMCMASWLFGIDMIPHRPFEVVFLLFLLCLYTLGIALICAVIGARWEDVGGLIIQPMRILYFISGIIIPIQELPIGLHKYLLWNPILHGIEQIRAHTFTNYDPGQTSISFLALSTVLVLFLGLSYFQLSRSKLLLR